MNLAGRHELWYQSRVARVEELRLWCGIPWRARKDRPIMIISNDYIAINRADEARTFFVATLGFKYLRTQTMPEQKMRVALLAAGEATVELLEPTAAEGPVPKFQNK